MFMSKNFDGIIPEMPLSEAEVELIRNIQVELTQYIDCMEKVRLRDALKCVLNISRLGNVHMQARQPWVLLKQGPAEKWVGEDEITFVRG